MPRFNYKHFTDLYDIPYMIVAFLYIGALLTFTVIVIFTRLFKCCNEKRKRKRKTTFKCTCCNGVFKWAEKFNRWILRLTFGKSEGVSEESGKDDEKDQETLEIDKSVYISGQKLKRIDVNILGSIVICFGLLVAINAYSTYLLEISHTCSEDSAVYCFPLPFDPNTSETLDPENRLMEPIDNCTEWTDSEIAPFITFQCFSYALDADGALAVAGGLLALFTMVTRTAISVITHIFQKCKLYRYKNCINSFQIVTAAILLPFDIVVAFGVIAIQLLSTVEGIDEKIAAYIANNGIQFVVAMGTIGLLLLIPWASYTDPNAGTGEENQQGSVESGGGNEELGAIELLPQKDCEEKISDKTASTNV